MTSFVEFAIGRQKSFGHHADDLSVSQQCRHIHQRPSNHQRQPDDDNLLMRFAVLGNNTKCFDRAAQQGVTCEQVTAGVAGQPKFGQQHQIGIRAINHPHRRISVGCRVGNRNRGCSRGDAKDAVRKQNSDVLLVVLNRAVRSL